MFKNQELLCIDNALLLHNDSKTEKGNSVPNKWPGLIPSKCYGY